MMSSNSMMSLLPNRWRMALAVSSIFITVGLIMGTPSSAQDKSPVTMPTPSDNIRYGYVIHQSVDLGGHIVDHSGSGAVYDTMVNLQSGPRILNQSLDLRAVNPSHAILFDHLSTSSFGYGGDPNSVSFLNVVKGKLYDFRGSFRRDRQYFDYNLLANPLIPPTSSPYVPLLDTPHLYNTVRRMTDLNLTLAPLSIVSVRLSYNHNISEGPSNSTLHYGTEALLSQFWRNSTDSWIVGADWKPVQRTSFSYDEFITHYKGNTSWQLTGLNYQLSNGTPVSLGIDISSIWKTPCAAPFRVDGTVSPTCNGYLAYSRSAPTRTLIPTEQLRFQSASIPNITMNGRLLYSAATNNLDHLNEMFNGLSSKIRESLITGAARVHRINVNGDYSLTWQITPTIIATNLFDFWDFRMPGTNNFTTTTYAGTTMLAPPGAATTTTASDYQFLNQKTKTNTFVVAWDVTGRARVSVGYRYRSRIITDAGGDFIPIHENWGLFGVSLRPTPQWRINLNVDAMYADNAFTRISPRQLQHYIMRTTYKPHLWLTFSGTVNIRESRDNIQTVNHLEHNRDFSFGTSISPSEHWSLDLNYAYDSVYSSTIECYASTPAPSLSGIAPPVCVAAGTPWLSTGYYNAPTQFGSIGFMLSPVKRVRLNGGYQMSTVNGTSNFINIRQVSGSLQSQFQSPYANLVIDIAPNWSWKANYNYYGYGEGSPIGPTLPRSFRGNVYTLAVHYAF
ncbi:hypothetical protein P8936_05840 [Edaphobacter paludis]|uniref:Uncharacterized protein n=1 Tax=Edaphobacter paludis TaxID=3035702 RepID=A0AAU7DC31_9BACT